MSAGSGTILAGENEVTVSHSLGVAPSAVLVTPSDGCESPIEVPNESISSSEFVVRFVGDVVLDADADFKYAAILQAEVPVEHSAIFSPVHYERSRMWKNGGGASAVLRRTLITPDYVAVVIDGVFYYIQSEQSLDLNVASAWDTVVGTDYTNAANRAGKNFYLYACRPSSGIAPVFLLSAATTYPAGYTALTSRKVVLIHCECADAGTISGHALTGYLAGDILPRSIQDLLHRPRGRFLPGFAWGGITDFDSLNYCPIWASIYHLSGTGANIASVFGAAAKTTYSYYSFAADMNLVGLRMMDDQEFSKLFKGTEEEKNIFGSANPTTCGGHVNTSSRRIISDIGLEDMGGVWWTWLSNQQSAIAGVDYAAAIAYSYEDIPTGVGSHYGQGSYPAQNAVLAGGAYSGGTYCGSRTRNATFRRSDANAGFGCRAVAEPQ